jgi:hypothetical protein
MPGRAMALLSPQQTDTPAHTHEQACLLWDGCVLGL